MALPFEYWLICHRPGFTPQHPQSSSKLSVTHTLTQRYMQAKHQCTWNKRISLWPTKKGLLACLGEPRQACWQGGWGEQNYVSGDPRSSGLQLWVGVWEWCVQRQESSLVNGWPKLQLDVYGLKCNSIDGILLFVCVCVKVVITDILLPNSFVASTLIY